MATGNQTIKIGYTYSGMNNHVLVLLLLVIALALLGVSVTKFMEPNISVAIVLFVLSLGLSCAALYCAAFLIRVILISPTHFILQRPYGKFWFKPFPKDMISTPLSNIDKIMIVSETDADGDTKENWKILLKNKSSVSFPYKADEDDLNQAMKQLARYGIVLQKLSR